MTKRRKNAGKGYGMLFHGAFGDKASAKKKERQVHGFIKPTNIRGERRYVVMSERKNPIRRRPQAKKTQTPNPMELAVMGANPDRQHNAHEIVVHPGQTITLRVNPAARAHTNPSADAIREDFTGRPADRITTWREPHMPAGDYALLGKLLMLYVKPMAGGQVLMIQTKGVEVVADERRRIWFVGGDQDVSRDLGNFGAVYLGSHRYELGTAVRIDYKQRKEHVPDPDADEWRHSFGEENGVKPAVLFDEKHKRLLLEGGDYTIEPRGIVN